MSVMHNLMHFKTADAPIIEQDGLRYIWQENILIDNDSSFELRKGGLVYSFKNAKGERSQTTYRQAVVGDAYFPFLDTQDFSADDSDLDNTIGVYTLEGTF